MSVCSVSATVTEGSEVTAVVTDQAIVDAAASGLQAVVLLNTWTRLVTQWDTPPTVAGSVASPVAGTVYLYTWGGVNRYRVVPTVYAAPNDSFYSDFDGTALTGLLVSRGVA